MAPTLLSGEVFAVREAVEVLGELHGRAYPETISAAGVDATGHPDQEPIGERAGSAVLGDEEIAKDELDPILARARIVDHRTDELVLLAVRQDRNRRSHVGPLGQCRRGPSPGSDPGETPDDPDKQQPAPEP